MASTGNNSASTATVREKNLAGKRVVFKTSFDDPFAPFAEGSTGLTGCEQKVDAVAMSQMDEQRLVRELLVLCGAGQDKGKDDQSHDDKRLKGIKGSKEKWLSSTIAVGVNRVTRALEQHYDSSLKPSTKTLSVQLVLMTTAASLEYSDRFALKHIPILCGLANVPCRSLPTAVASELAAAWNMRRVSVLALILASGDGAASDSIDELVRWVCGKGPVLEQKFLDTKRPVLKALRIKTRKTALRPKRPKNTKKETGI